MSVFPFCGVLLSSWNHYKHASVDLPVEKLLASCHIRAGSRLEIWTSFLLPFKLQGHLRIVLKETYFFLFPLLISKNLPSFGQSSYVNDENVLFYKFST